jgi:4,5-DOPA dioxygenase extradiol
MSPLPTLFVGHGSPMNALINNAYTRALRDLGGSLPRPRAVVVVSAHWLTSGAWVQGSANPKTIHDFAGFPAELYSITYQVPGAPDVAQRARELNANITPTEEWGLDHGAWSVLVHMFPQRDIPILQLSLNRHLNLAQHFAVAKTLQSLRHEGVLILASGNLTHNLRT